MQTDSLDTKVALEDAAKKAETGATINPHSKYVEYIFRFAIVVTAIILAGITALIISLFTGWFPITC